MTRPGWLVAAEHDARNYAERHDADAIPDRPSRDETGDGGPILTEPTCACAAECRMCWARRESAENARNLAHERAHQGGEPRE